MTKIISKLGMVRLCLISFILMCSVFTSENSYSIHYDKRDTVFKYDSKTNSIIFSFLFHLYAGIPREDGYLESCEFWFGKTSNAYSKLLCVSTKDQKNNNRVSITMQNIRLNENVCYLTSVHPESMKQLPEGTSVTVDVEANYCETKDFKIKTAILNVIWKLSERVGRVNYFNMTGFWRSTHKLQGDRIYEVYPLHNIKLNTNTMENTPSELNSEVSDKVMVTGESDAINVTGVEPGENIRICTASGVEVKSVVANDEVLNIKLPTNQLYIVKAGQARYKVAL